MRDQAMKLDALDHPKTLDFAARLGVELPTAIGHLELLWAFTAQKSPQGNIGKWPDGAIARACYWNGDPAKFVAALKDSKFVDTDQTHRLLIHDWHEHAPRWVRAKLSGAKLQFLTIVATTVGTTDDSVDESETVLNGHCSADSVRQGKSKQEKGGETTGAETGPAPNDVLLAEHFFQLIQVLNPKHKPPNFKSWANDIRLMRERDNRTLAEIRELFQWANNDPFWKTNILSPATLRKQWDKLVIQRDNRRPNGPHQRADTSAPGRVRAANGIRR